MLHEDHYVAIIDILGYKEIVLDIYSHLLEGKSGLDFSEIVIPSLDSLSSNKQTEEQAPI